MNQGFFVGRVGGDAECRYLQDGTAVASFSLAIDQGKDRNGQKRAALWVKATIWRERAEKLVEYITKGKMIAVSGPISSEAWIGRDDGEAKSKICVTVNQLTFCSGKSDSSESEQQEPAAAPAAAGPITDDDIPF